MPSKEQAKEELKKLILRYQQQKAVITNEEQTCQSLVLPLFQTVLGWDTEDPAEFKAQESQKTGKRSDYVASLNGISQFVIEGKALGEEIKQVYAHYQQAINYAKYKEKIFSILTNFRNIIILRADTEEQPLQCEVKVINIERILENNLDFDVLWNFSRELWAAEKGEGLYKLLRPGKKAVPVSKSLVEEMSRWRLSLLNNLSRNKALNSFADLSQERSYIEQEVQRLIDRLIFICYCEDKELRDRELRNLLEIKEAKHSGNDRWLGAQIKDLFSDYRRQYDSDLFFEQGYCDKFVFQDAVLADIVRDLRKPNKKLPYNFAEIDADVLGKAYENYIGHVITGEKRLSEKESISKRKEEGAYYTPQYIVNYIVDNTLREYIQENKIASFGDLLEIKVLDPACGSGTFLIRSLEVLEEEARKILARDITEVERVQLALSCIFGVDLDERAVDIAKLRLSLALAARQKLPQLGKNIQCGNSLIDDEKIAGGKAFKWEERFKGIMQNGGFDVVVGNPPYVRVDSLDKKDRLYFKRVYKSSEGKYDIYYLFLEHAYDLARAKGKVGFIVPNKFCAASSAAALRTVMLKKSSDLRIISVSSLDIFADAANYPVIVICETGVSDLQKINIASAFKLNKFMNNEIDVCSLKMNELSILPSNVFPINATQGQIDIVLNLLSKNRKFLDAIKISEGLRISPKLEEKGKADFEIVKQFQFERWSPVNEGANISEKNLKKVISDNSERYANILKPKILIAEDALRITATADFHKRIPQGGVYFAVLLKEDTEFGYVLALFNSSLQSFIYKILFGGMHMGGGYLRYRTEFLENLPLKVTDKKEQSKLSIFSDKLLSLHRRLSEFGDRHGVERERIEEDIKKTDAAIDELVYQLYGITDEEKKIIEESLK